MTFFQRFLLAALSAFILFPAAAHAQATDKASPSYLSVVEADGGTFKKVGRNNFVIRFKGVDRVGSFFTDRPLHQAGEATTKSLIDRFFKPGTGAPNAAIRVRGAHNSQDTLIVELSKPRYSARKRTLRLHAKLLLKPRTGVSRFKRRADRKLPKRFSRATLFIDSFKQQCYVQVSLPWNATVTNLNAHSDFGESLDRTNDFEGIGSVKFGNGSFGSSQDFAWNQSGSWDEGCGGTVSGNLSKPDGTPLGYFRFRYQDPEIGSNKWDHDKTAPGLTYNMLNNYTSGSTPTFHVSFAPQDPINGQASSPGGWPF